MLNKNKNKLLEQFIQLQIEEVDIAFIQDQLTDMQNFIEDIKQNLPNIDKSRIEIIYQLTCVTMTMLEQIDTNLIIKEWE